MNMDYFVRATGPVMKYSAEDVVLDVGCGAGYLHESLRTRVREVHGVDVSERYLEHCRKKFEGVSNCRFYKLDERDYTNLSFLPERAFTKIVCLSVVQYYDRKEDLGALIRSMQRVAAPGAVALVSDIPATVGTGSDAVSLLALAAKERHLVDTLRYLLKMRFSEYHSVRTKNGVLRYEPDELARIARDMGLAAEVMSDQLTVNRSRLHLLLRF